MKFVTREQAGLRPPKSTPNAITSEGTTGHYAGGSIWNGVIGDHSRCASIWRAFQAYHMDHQGWSDLAYNAGVCPHGYVFEGRGPGRRSAANGTNTANGRSAVVCYIGGKGDPFTTEAKNAMLDAAVYLQGDLIWGHRDWFSTECPDDEIYGWIHSNHPMPVPAPSIEEEDMKWLFKVENDATVWITDLITKRHVKSEKELADIVYLNLTHGGKLLFVPESGTAVAGSGDYSMVRKLDSRRLIDAIPTVS